MDWPITQDVRHSGKDREIFSSFLSCQQISSSRLIILQNLEAHALGLIHSKIQASWSISYYHFYYFIKSYIASPVNTSWIITK